MRASEPIPIDRVEDYRGLIELLMAHAAVSDKATLEIAEWIARSALEPGHLWRAMGVQSRDDLRLTMKQYFPELEAANDKDMRWKKFLYKRLCGWSGFTA